MWHSHTIWRHRCWSTFAQVMVCYLMATSHYLIQCWLTISEVLWHSHGNNFLWKANDISPSYEYEVYYFEITGSLSLDDAFETLVPHKRLCLSWGHRLCNTKHSLFSVLLFGIILCMLPANERRRYIVMPSLIGWAYPQFGPCCYMQPTYKRSSLIRRGSGGAIWSDFSFLSGSSLIEIGLLVRLWYWWMVFIHRIDKPLLTLA